MPFKPKNTQERILHRLKIARGQLEKVIKMVEENEYYIDVLHQSNAVQKALKQTDSVIVEHHLKELIDEAVVKHKKEKVIEELTKFLKKRH